VRGRSRLNFPATESEPYGMLLLIWVWEGICVGSRGFPWCCRYVQMASLCRHESRLPLPFGFGERHQQTRFERHAPLSLGGDSDWQCLEERDGDGDLVARFTYAPGYIDAVAVQERDLNADGDFGDANEVVYYHSNTLFSVYALTDGDESVVERYHYDAYGACTVLDSDWSADADSASDVNNSYLLIGRRRGSRATDVYVSKVSEGGLMPP